MNYKTALFKLRVMAYGVVNVLLVVMQNLDICEMYRNA